MAQTDVGPARQTILGPDLVQGQFPQSIVPMGEWQAERTLGDYTLGSCTASPGFQFGGFEMAPTGFDISAQTPA